MPIAPRRGPDARRPDGSPLRQLRPPSTPPPVTYVVPGETTSPKFAKAFAAGCRGHMVNTQMGLQTGAFAAFCTPATWPLLEQARREGRDWYYGDHAFYKRGKYYRVTKNAYQYVPTERDLAAATSARFTAVNGDIHPEWRRGTAVVVCPNSEVYMRHFGIDAREWTMDVVRQIAAVTDRPIVVRWKAVVGRRPFYVDCHDAWAVVVFSSNAAVEALMAGVPIFVTAPWASTAQMGLSDLSQIESPYFPESSLRERFLWALAERQWTLDEIRAGYAWRALQ